MGACPWTLRHVPDHLKTEEMCKRAIEADIYTLVFCSNWFVTQEQMKSWHDDDYYCNDDRMIRWYDGYQKRKAQKAQIKEGLMPIA